MDLTFNISNLLGANPDYRRTKVWLETNIPDDVIVDSSGNEIRLGTVTASVSQDGTGVFEGVIETNALTNPTGWQYQVHVDYPDAHAPKGRASWASGWFSLPVVGGLPLSTDLADVAAEVYVPPTYSSTLMSQLDDHAAGLQAPMDAAVAQAEAARDAAVDISNISTSDAVVEALVKNTGGAGPLTSAALANIYVSQSRRAKNLRDMVTPSGTNDIPAVNAALAAFDAAGGGTLRIPRDDWKFTGTTGLALTGTVNPIHIEADDGCVFDMTGVTAAYAAKFGGGATATTAALGADVAKGAETITCATVAAAVVPGSIVRLASTDLFETLQNLVKGEMAEVLSVSGSTITLRSALRDSYTAATTTVTLLQMPRVSVEGLTLLWNANITGLSISYAREAELGGLYGEGARATLFQLDNAFGATADQLTGRDFWYSGGGSCYGLQVGSSQHIKEIGLELRGGRHAISHGGTYPTRDVQTIGGTFDSYHPAALAAFDYHGNCEDTSIVGATILNGLLVQASNAHVGGGTRIRATNRPAVEIGPSRSCDYVKIENADIETTAAYDGIAYTARNGANATTLGLLKIDATIRAGATGVKVKPNSSSDTGATIDRLVIRGDVLSGGSSSAVEVSKATAAYVGINQAELDGRFRSPAQTTVVFTGTSSGPAKFRGDYQTDGNGFRAMDVQMFGDVFVRAALLKGTHATPFRSKFTNSGGLYLNDVTIDGAFAAAFEAGAGPTELMQSNVRRINGAGAATAVPARHFTRINEDGTVVTITGTAAPSSGAWIVGDRAERRPQAVGSPKAWVCTVAGTPGTWVSEGNL